MNQNSTAGESMPCSLFLQIVGKEETLPLPPVSSSVTATISQLLHAAGGDADSTSQTPPKNTKAVFNNVDKNVSGSFDNWQQLSTPNPGSAYSRDTALFRMDSGAFVDQPLLRNPSSLLMEMGQRLSFTKNSSNTYNQGFFTFSRNPSNESMLYPIDAFHRNPSFTLENDPNVSVL